jgi:hypothetical protein
VRERTGDLSYKANTYFYTTGYHVQIVHELDDCPAVICGFRSSYSNKDPTLVMVGCIAGSLWGYNKGYPVLQFELFGLSHGLMPSEEDVIDNLS